MVKIKSLHWPKNLGELKPPGPWGPPQGGPGGPWPPKENGGGGEVPPNFRENSVMYTINVQWFSLKKNRGMHA